MSGMEQMLQDNCRFVCIHSAQKKDWQLVKKVITIHINFFSAQQEQEGITLSSNQIIMTTHACLRDANERGIRNKKEDQIKTKVSTPLINDLEMQNIFKDEDNKKGNDVINKLIDEVLQLLVLVGLTAQ